MFIVVVNNTTKPKKKNYKINLKKCTFTSTDGIINYIIFVQKHNILTWMT